MNYNILTLHAWTFILKATQYIETHIRLKNLILTPIFSHVFVKVFIELYSNSTASIFPLRMKTNVESTEKLIPKSSLAELLYL